MLQASGNHFYSSPKEIVLERLGSRVVPGKEIKSVAGRKVTYVDDGERSILR